MRENRFFGYGSLVNADTYPATPALTPAKLSGWRRVWSPVAAADGTLVSTLSVIVDPSTTIEGVVYAPENAAEQDWLDRRESGYDKAALDAGALRSLDGAPIDGRLFTYQLRPTGVAAAPIMRSYLDAVLQGFYRVFGPEGARRFMLSTDGWRAPVFDDRASPQYPRAVRLCSEEAQLIDALLGEIGGCA